MKIEADVGFPTDTELARVGHGQPDPGASWVLMKRGVLTVYFSCTNKVTWEAGRAYSNPPSEMAINEGDEPVELVVIYVNVPADHPAGVIPASPAPPPADCPL